MTRSRDDEAFPSWLRWSTLAVLGLACLGYMLLAGPGQAGCNSVFMTEPTEFDYYGYPELRIHNGLRCNSLRIVLLAWSVPATLLTVFFGGMAMMAWNRARSNAQDAAPREGGQDGPRPGGP
jgi:hypothetical protein